MGTALLILAGIGLGVIVYALVWLVVGLVVLIRWK